MKKILLLILVIPYVSICQQTAKKSPSGTGYLEYLPASYYTDTTKLYPCIIFLHGSGERGLGTPEDLAKITRHGPPKYIAAGHKMCFVNPVTKAQECFIVLSPQTYRWYWKYEARAFAKWALTKYRIDSTRLFVTGLSMGGEGTWYAASKEDNVNNIWAAIAPVCGRAYDIDGVNVSNRKIPVWGFHGSADESIALEAGLKPVNGMMKQSGTSYFEFTTYPGGKHVTAWDRAYRTDHSYHNPNLYEWFLTKKKN